MAKSQSQSNLLKLGLKHPYSNLATTKVTIRETSRKTTTTRTIVSNSSLIDLTLLEILLLTMRTMKKNPNGKNLIQKKRLEASLEEKLLMRESSEWRSKIKEKGGVVIVL